MSEGEISSRRGTGESSLARARARARAAAAARHAFVPSGRPASRVGVDPVVGAMEGDDTNPVPEHTSGRCAQAGHGPEHGGIGSPGRQPPRHARARRHAGEVQPCRRGPNATLRCSIAASKKSRSPDRSQPQPGPARRPPWGNATTAPWSVHGAIRLRRIWSSGPDRLSCRLSTTSDAAPEGSATSMRRRVPATSRRRVVTRTSRNLVPGAPPPIARSGHLGARRARVC